MQRGLRNRALIQAVAFLFVMSLAAGTMASVDLTRARLIPKSKVSIYEGSTKVGELSSEAPLPEGRILTSSEKCAVRLDGLYLVAAENTRFGLTPGSGTMDLFVQEGRVYFALGEFRQTLSFSTPQDSVTVQSSVIQASAGSSTVKGYLLYENERMEIGVMEGGKLMVANADGQQLIEPGNSLRVEKAQADLKKGGTAAPLLGGGSKSVLIGAGVAVGVTVGGMAALGAFDSDDGGAPPPPPPASAFQP